MSLWDWSLAAWKRPGVEAAALKAQDERGESIALLLWRAWTGETDAATAQAAERLAEGFEHEVLAPLRQARRALKAAREDMSGLEPLRAQVRAAELAGERGLLEALEALAGDAGDAAAAFARLDQALGLGE